MLAGLQWLPFRQILPLALLCQSLLRNRCVIDIAQAACLTLAMDPVKQYLATIGSRGGKAGGPVKARNPEKMREAQKKSVVKRKANQSKTVSVNEHGHSLGVENSLK